MRETINAFLARLDQTIQAHGQPEAVDLAIYADQASIDALCPDQPGLTLADHQAITKVVADELSARNITLNLVLMDVAEFERWRGDRPHTAALRAEYAGKKAKNWIAKPPYRLGLKIDVANKYINKQGREWWSGNAIGWAIFELGVAAEFGEDKI